MPLPSLQYGAVLLLLGCMMLLASLPESQAQHVHAGDQLSLETGDFLQHFPLCRAERHGLGRPRSNLQRSFTAAQVLPVERKGDPPVHGKPSANEPSCQGSSLLLTLSHCCCSGTLSCLPYPAEDRHPEKLSGRTVREASTTNGCVKGKERRDHARCSSRR